MKSKNLVIMQNRGATSKINKIRLIRRIFEQNERIWQKKRRSASEARY